MKKRLMKLVIISILFVLTSAVASFSQPGGSYFPACFKKTLITENGKTVDANRLIVKVRYAYCKKDTLTDINQRVPVTWKEEHPVNNDTIFLQQIPGIHSYLITLDRTETKIYFPSKNIPCQDASIYKLNDYPNYYELFAKKIADPLQYSDKKVAILNVTNIIEWNKLEAYDEGTQDSQPHKNPLKSVNQITLIPIVPNLQNTIQKPDSVIQVLFRNSDNELVQDCRLSLLYGEDKFVPLELLSYETEGYGYGYYLIPNGYREPRERYQRIIAFHEDYQIDTFHINIGNHQFYLFKDGEPWICIGNKIPYKKPKSKYMLVAPLNSTISFDTLALHYDMTIDSLLMNDPFGGDGLKKAFCSFKRFVDEDTQLKVIDEINKYGRIIYPLYITYSESYEQIVGLGNGVSVLFENSISKELVLDLLRESGLESPVVNYYHESYQTAQAKIPKEWDLEKIRLILNHLHNKRIFLRVGIDNSF